MSERQTRGSVVLFGDSHLTDKSSRHTMKLGPRLRDLGWHVVTHAVGGLTTRDALALTTPPVADWTVFGFGTNDAAPWKQVSLDEFVTNYRQLLGRRAGGCIVLGPGPLSLEAQTSGRSQQLLDSYSREAERVAAEVGARFLSLRAVLTLDDLAPDGIHIDNSGYSKLADALTIIFGTGR